MKLIRCFRPRDSCFAYHLRLSDINSYEMLWRANSSSAPRRFYHLCISQLARAQRVNSRGATSSTAREFVKINTIQVQIQS